MSDRKYSYDVKQLTQRQISSKITTLKGENKALFEAISLCNVFIHLELEARRQSGNGGEAVVDREWRRAGVYLESIDANQDELNMLNDARNDYVQDYYDAETWRVRAVVAHDICESFYNEFNLLKENA